MKYISNTFTRLIQFFILNSTLLIVSCSVSKQLSHSANNILINDATISTGHIGISIYEPATNTYLYNYDATKYFVPASNTKLFTLYAGMKYLGDSLIGLRYNETDSSITIFPTGDPTFLHKDFVDQPVLDFLKKEKRKFYINPGNWKEQPLGIGWAWDDYNDSYMVERSPFPIFGNVTSFSLDFSKQGHYQYFILFKPQFFEKQNTDPEIKNLNTFRYSKDFHGYGILDLPMFILQRDKASNQFKQVRSRYFFSGQEIPFCTDTIATTLKILNTDYSISITDTNSIVKDQLVKTIYSQPIDSLFKPMMHNSDNFFAEQTLLMASNEHLGYMSDVDMIDTLLNKDLQDVPQKPKWVDGSGLSRYNLFTPQDFVYILNKMKNEFGLKRLEIILPTGGEGSLKNYYLKDSGFIYAKTGSLSNNNSLSGFLITKKNKLLIFSIMVNNYQGSSIIVRKAFEQFLEGIREKY